jgi:hypothetical protein
MIRVIIYILAALFFLPSAGPAQMEFVRSLGPEIGKAKPVFQYQVSPYSKEEVEGQNTDFGSPNRAAFFCSRLFKVRATSGRFWAPSGSRISKPAPFFRIRAKFSPKAFGTSGWGPSIATNSPTGGSAEAF